MPSPTQLLQGVLLTALCFTGIGCQKADDVAPADPALLGHWYLVPISGVHTVALPPKDLEFATGNELNIYLNNSLTSEGTYRSSRDSRVEVPSGFSLLELDVTTIDGKRYPTSQTYRIVNDTLYWNSPVYKGMTNCFPINERYARTPPVTGPKR